MKTHRKYYVSTLPNAKDAEVVFQLDAEHTRGWLLQVRVCPKTGTTFVVIEQGGESIQVGSQNATYGDDYRPEGSHPITWGRALQSQGKDGKPVQVVYLTQPGRPAKDLDLTV